MTPIQSALIRAEKARAAMRAWDHVAITTNEDERRAFSDDEAEILDAEAALANLVSDALGVNVDRLIGVLS